jgi:hypothetical protein
MTGDYSTLDVAYAPALAVVVPTKMLTAFCVP